MPLTFEDHLEIRTDMAGVIDRSAQLRAESAAITRRMSELSSMAASCRSRYGRALLQAGPGGEGTPEAIAAEREYEQQHEQIAHAMNLELSKIAALRRRNAQDILMTDGAALQLGSRPLRLVFLVLVCLAVMKLATLSGEDVAELVRGAPALAEAAWHSLLEVIA